MKKWWKMRISDIYFSLAMRFFLISKAFSRGAKWALDRSSQRLEELR